MTTENRSAGDRLREAATGQASQSAAAPSFPAMLEKHKIQIAAALPKHLNADRMARIALTCFRQTPKLAECDPRSVFAAVIVGAQLGLEPGILGQAYLVPYRDRRANKTICQFIPGWQGMCDLVNRSGRASVWTGAVYEGDEFEYEYGSAPFVHHKPGAAEEDPEKLTHVYAIGRVKGAEYPVIEVWPRLKVERHRDRYNKVGDSHYSYSHFEMYARKVALLQVLKYMPKSVELTAGFAANEAAETGTPIDLKDAIEGTYAPVPAEESTTEAAQADTGGKPE